MESLEANQIIAAWEPLVREIDAISTLLGVFSEDQKTRDKSSKENQGLRRFCLSSAPPIGRP
jgi:hypothetical protein